MSFYLFFQKLAISRLNFKVIGTISADIKAKLILKQK